MSSKYIIELLQTKVDIKLNFRCNIKGCCNFLNLCYKHGISWNGAKPDFIPPYIFVMNHVKGYRLTYTNDTPKDIGFYLQHKAREIKFNMGGSVT